MKAIVFDNAGTLLKRVTAIKDVTTQEIFYETNTIGMANQNVDNIIVVFQTPAHDLIKYSNWTIKDYMTEYSNSFEIAYSQKDISKAELLSILSDEVLIYDFKETALELINNNIDICSGCAIIVDTLTGNITYVYTAGGVFFEYTSTLIETLKDRGYEIYIASGDNKQSLLKVASILNISENNIFDTCNIDCKRNVVSSLQKNGYYVFMVGNHTNDKSALKKADIGILTIQQKEKLPHSLYKQADYVIDNIKDVMEIVEKIEYEEEKL